MCSRPGRRRPGLGDGERAAAGLGDAPRPAARMQQGHVAAGMERAGRRTTPGLEEARRPSARKQEGRGIQRKEAGMGRHDAGRRGRRWRVRVGIGSG